MLNAPCLEGWHSFVTVETKSKLLQWMVNLRFLQQTTAAARGKNAWKSKTQSSKPVACTFSVKI